MYHPFRKDENGDVYLYFLCPECQARFEAEGGTLEDILPPEFLAELNAQAAANEARWAGEAEAARNATPGTVPD